MPDTDLAIYLSLGTSEGLSSFIDSAVAMLENKHGIAIRLTQYKYTATQHQASTGYTGFSNVPQIKSQYITLPTANADTVTSVKEGGEVVAFTSNGNRVYTSALCDIEILYSAGYTLANIPADIKQSVLQLAGYMYDKRGACNDTDAITASGSAIKKYEVYL